MIVETLLVTLKARIVILKTRIMILTTRIVALEALPATRNSQLATRTRSVRGERERQCPVRREIATGALFVFRRADRVLAGRRARVAEPPGCHRAAGETGQPVRAELTAIVHDEKSGLRVRFDVQRSADLLCPAVHLLVLLNDGAAE